MFRWRVVSAFEKRGSEFQLNSGKNVAIATPLFHPHISTNTSCQIHRLSSNHLINIIRCVKYPFGGRPMRNEAEEQENEEVEENEEDE